MHMQRTFSAFLVELREGLKKIQAPTEFEPMTFAIYGMT